MAVATASGIFSSTEMILLKDYWFLLVALFGGVVYLIKTIWGIAKKISKIDSFGVDIESLKKDSSYIRGKVCAIEKLMKGTFAGFNIPSTPGLIQGHSPLGLTDRGREILIGCGFKDIYKANKSKLLELVKKQEPKLKYEVQEVAFTVLMDLSNDKILEPLKKYAFEHGLNIIDLIKVSTIYFRDKIIKELDIKE